VEVSGNAVYCSGPSGGFAPLDVGQWTENVTAHGNQIHSLGTEIARFDTNAQAPRK